MTSHRTDEGGLLTMYVAIASVGLLVLCGLVIDGGYILAGRRQAFDEANGAARAGAASLAVDSYITGSGDVPIDPNRAEAAAQAFLAATGHAGTVTVTGEEVNVQMSFEQPTSLLGMIGIRSVTVTGLGRPRAVPGITTADAP